MSSTEFHLKVEATNRIIEGVFSSVAPCTVLRPLGKMAAATHILSVSREG
jgi:hypothetical protein